MLAGGHASKDIFINPLSWYAANSVTLHAGVRVDTIDLKAKLVSSASGIVEPYDTLVIATGSNALVPPIAGVFDAAGHFKEGVFVFRTLDDCDHMLTRATTSKRAAVIGGGLLGLEAAKGLLNRGLEVHVVHLMSHVMEVQLDAMGGAVLARQLDEMEIGRASCRERVCQYV